jgi:hypothetical protein
LYRHYQLGLFPDEGGVFDQAAYAIRMFEHLDSIYADIRDAHDEAREKGKKKTKRKKPARTAGEAA